MKTTSLHDANARRIVIGKSCSSRESGDNSGLYPPREGQRHRNNPRRGEERGVWGWTLQMPAVAFPRAAICLLDRESETARPDNKRRLTALGSARGLAGWGLVALQPDCSYVRGAGELSTAGRMSVTWKRAAWLPLSLTGSINDACRVALRGASLSRLSSDFCLPFPSNCLR